MRTSGRPNPLDALGRRLVGLLIHPEQRRLRTTWRLVLCFALLYVLQLFFRQLDAIFGISTPSVIRSLASAFLAVFLACPLFDRRRYGELGFQVDTRWWLDLVFGAFVGGALIGILFVLAWTLGWLTIEGFWEPTSASDTLLRGLTGWLGFILAASVTEELLLHGYLLTNLAEGFGASKRLGRHAVLIAWFLVACLFGLLHLNNPHASWISTLNLVLAGMFLALPYVLTGSLGMSIGLHLGWNVFLGPVFGLPVSGLNMGGASLLRVTLDGPVAWTGGAFGPEAGLLGLLGFAVGSLCILLWVVGMDGRVAFSPGLPEPPDVEGE